MCTRNQAFEILKIVYHACDPILGHSIHDAILYGSYARGDFTAESDIDILLTADLTQEQIASQRRAVSGVASTLSLDTISRFLSTLCRWHSSSGMWISCRSIRTC